MSSLGLIEIAQPVMSDLATEVHESCSASVVDGHDVVYARAPSKHRIMSISLNVGTRLPAHCSSMGPVLLAGLSPASLDCFFSDTSLSKSTDRTIVDPAVLREIVRKKPRAGLTGGTRRRRRAAIRPNVINRASLKVMRKRRISW
jgi:IclR family pca regulon transcriptional regulator